MSHLLAVVLVIALSWFTIALIVGIALGTLIRRAGALARVRETAGPVRQTRARASDGARSISYF